MKNSSNPCIDKASLVPTIRQLDKIRTHLQALHETLDGGGKAYPFPKKQFEALIPPQFWPENVTWKIILRAASYGNLSWLKGLVDLGIDLDIRPDGASGECAWFVALDKKKSQTIEVLEWLLDPQDLKVDPNLPELKYSKQSALIYACSHYACADFVELLLKAGANPNYLSEYSPTEKHSALHSLIPNLNSFVSDDDSEKIIRLLIQYGLDLHQQINGVPFMETLNCPSYKQDRLNTILQDEECLVKLSKLPASQSASSTPRI